MTVEAGASEFVYVGDGVTTTFPFPSRFLEAGDIAVGVGYVEQTSGYTVLGAGAESGGAVVFSVAPPAGAQVALLCRTSPSQLVDFVNGQTVLEGVLNNALDRRALVEQYLLRCVGRSLRLADFDPVSMPELPGAADRAGKLVGFSQSGAMTLFNGAGYFEDMAAAVAAAQAAAETHATAAAASDASAATHATAAAASDASAATHATAAAANNASSGLSATASQTSAAASQASASSAATSLATIRAKLLPAAAADPTTDEGGAAVADGATYWSTSLSRLRQRVAGVWRTLNSIILSTTGAPAAGTGADGDFAIDPTGKVLYGPKAGGAWPVGVGLGGMVLKRIDVLTSSGSYTKQAGDTLYRVIVIGAGGGGGSGAKLSTNGAVVAGGGAGGAGGSINILTLNAADLPASVTYVIGAGGSGGAAISTAATAGAAGGTGGNSRFDNSISAGGTGGAGGSLTTVPADTASVYGYANTAIMADPGSNIVNYNKGQGGSAGNTYVASPGTTGGGCGQHLYNSAAYGSAASCRSGIAGHGQPSSAAGVSVFGGGGSAGVTTSRGNGCGSGGGGGSAAVTGAAGNGGAGGNYGGGGGGGGAGMDAASAGGAGGAGAPGCIIVFVYG